MSELINLQEKDISSGSIKVLGKRNKERIIPISDELKAQIQQYIQIKKATELRSEFLLVLNNDNKLQDFSSDKVLGLFKNFMSKLLQTELKLNTALPLGSFLADKVENPLLKMGVKVFSISTLVTALSETFRAVGWQPNSTLNDANILSSGCPLCGSVNVGECISSDIGPAASMGDDLTKKVGLV